MSADSQFIIDDSRTLVAKNKDRHAVGPRGVIHGDTMTAMVGRFLRVDKAVSYESERLNVTGSGRNIRVAGVVPDPYERRVTVGAADRPSGHAQPRNCGYT